jgi:hexokinase
VALSKKTELLSFSFLNARISNSYPDTCSCKNVRILQSVSQDIGAKRLFWECVQTEVWEQMGREDKCKLLLVEDGSGLGAALVGANLNNRDEEEALWHNHEDDSDHQGLL